MKMMLRSIFQWLLMGLLLAPRAAASDFQKNIDTCARIVENFKTDIEYPSDLFDGCKGVAILAVGKAGFIFSAHGGGGLVVAKTEEGWSAPSSIKLGGAGFGFQIGAELTEHVIVLNTDEALKAFSRGGNVTLGADLSVAAGPIGRNASMDFTILAAVITYSKSKGLFAGVSLEGAVLVEGDGTNSEYYGRTVDVSELLGGDVPPPEGADRLYRALNDLM